MTATPTGHPPQSWGWTVLRVVLLIALFAVTCTWAGGLRPVPRVVEVNDAR